jgi:hypothetical protein
VKIIAKNAATGASYSGLEYKVISSRTAANGEKYKTEASGTLNSNGEAMVSIKKKSGRSYSIQVKAPENSCYTNQSPQFFDSPFDVNGTFTFEFAECAYLKFRLNNSYCFNSNDKIVLERNTNLSNYDEFTAPAIQIGCVDYIMNDFANVPMGYWYLKWTVTKNNVETNFSDTIFLDKNEELLYEINY